MICILGLMQCLVHAMLHIAERMITVTAIQIIGMGRVITVTTAKRYLQCIAIAQAMPFFKQKPFGGSISETSMFANHKHALTD